MPEEPRGDAPARDEAARVRRQDERRRRTRWGVAIVLALIYVGSLLAYGYSVSNRSEFNVDQPDQGLIVLVQVQDIDTVRGVLRGTLQIQAASDELLGEAGSLTHDVRLTLIPGEPSEITLPAGSQGIFVQRTLSIPIEVQIERYPFDSYETPVVILAQAATGPDGELEAVPVSTGLSSDLAGWVVRRGTIPDDGEVVTSTGATVLVITLRRAGSTIAISLLLLSLMVVLGVLALLVARAVGQRRRKVEATMAGWFAAMLFALIPLRTNLPGAPPLGAWIDYVVFFWVEVTLMLALASFVDAWLRMGPSPDPRTEPATHGPSDAT